MLMVTENAGHAIEAIVANAELPDGSGLRIDAPDQPLATPDRSGIPLQLEVTSAPAAAPILDDKVLDVRVSEDKERVQFVIGPQQSQPGEPG
jgi:hypothetical protein